MNKLKVIAPLSVIGLMLVMPEIGLSGDAFEDIVTDVGEPILNMVISALGYIALFSVVASAVAMYFGKLDFKQFFQIIGIAVGIWAVLSLTNNVLLDGIRDEAKSMVQDNKKLF